MNRKERLEYLETHQEELEYQIEQSAISTYNLIHDIEKDMTIESLKEWNRNWMYKQIDLENANCKEEVNGVDISKYLSMIRNDRLKENELNIYFKDGEIIGYDIFTSNQIDKVIRVDNSKFVDEVTKYCKKNNADAVCLIHNHPMNFAVTPSKTDRNAAKWIGDGLKSNGIKLLDYSVVSIEDYYSFAQKSY